MVVKVHKLWYICIILRLFICILPLVYEFMNDDSNKMLSIITMNKYILTVIGIGFLYKSVFGSNNEIQINKVFWHNTRIIHALLYTITAINFDNYKLSFFLLLCDVLFSITYRYLSNHF